MDNYFNLKKEHKKESIRSALRTPLTVFCSCGKKNFIPYHMDKKICTWCNNYVYRDEKTRFKYEMQKRIKLKK